MLFSRVVKVLLSKGLGAVAAPPPPVFAARIVEIINLVYQKRPKIFTPITLKRKILKIIRISPETAEVKSDFPSVSFAGSPAEVIILNPASRNMKKVNPPPIPKSQTKKKLVNRSSTLIGIQPIAVCTPSPLF
jgi:hypothetical protein